MTDPDPNPTSPGAEGLDHLQRAAKEMVAAARSFLDAIEQVVEDREALKEVSTTVTGLAATVGEALGDAVRGGRPAPWVDPAWTPDGEGTSGPSGTAGPGAPPAPTTRGPEASAGDDVVAPAVAPSPAEDDVDDNTEDWARPLVDPGSPRRPSRVRRIAVD
ncbi:hypothetical protein [Dermatobacter hominis]|uniref:hypothetical protein n=1 Tax=Dermatobacter hominis TaxID=2884263 RepID=UPI001D12BC9C|nr:hypothetical protein [Dermatobacter hominis]UDY35942.1 hypothetical protein LH044_00020 [Dermatobacter hominis]